MKKSHIVLLAAISVLASHVLFLPYVMLGTERLPWADRLNVLLLVAPLTAAYVTAIVKFAIDNPGRIPNGNTKVGPLYAIVAFASVVPFIISIFGAVALYETERINDLSDLKVYISAIEIYFGSMFGLFLGSIFSGAGRI